jgi:hypothetical protein
MPDAGAFSNLSGIGYIGGRMNSNGHTMGPWNKEILMIKLRRWKQKQFF